MIITNPMEGDFGPSILTSRPHDLHLLGSTIPSFSLSNAELELKL
jgi:hypothetical protein